MVAKASPDCALYEGDYKVNQQLPGHGFFAYVAHVACLQDSSKPAAATGFGGGELHLHSIPAADADKWIALGSVVAAAADPDALAALTTLYDSR